jgi:hypothetical protein
MLSTMELMLALKDVGILNWAVTHIIVPLSKCQRSTVSLGVPSKVDRRLRVSAATKRASIFTRSRARAEQVPQLQRFALRGTRGRRLAERSSRDSTSCFDSRTSTVGRARRVRLSVWLPRVARSAAASDRIYQRKLDTGTASFDRRTADTAPSSAHRTRR